MPTEVIEEGASPSFSRRLRLDTLIRLRWLAVTGQSAAIIAVELGLGFPMPLGLCFLVIGASALLNLWLRFKYPVNERLDTVRSATILAFDILQLAALLYLTGGLENPFSLLFLAPVLISAASLPPLPTLLLGLLAMTCASVLALHHQPLPWMVGVPFELSLLYVGGVWTAILLAIAFIGVYAWRVAEEGRQLSDALTATELVLAREQHLSALDGLAAAAAHELGTPLATIRLVVKELDRAIPAGDPIKDDVTLLREQVDRCREILLKLTSLHEDAAPHATLTLRHFLEDVATPHRDFGVSIRIEERGSEGPEPVIWRNPGLLYGLGNLIENAVDFARSEVVVTARWDGEHIETVIVDDGPGFAPEVIERLGDPYVTTRGAAKRTEAAPGGAGLGLGVFIAKTLIERSGASVGFDQVPGGGAMVRIVWPRAELERAVPA